VTLETEIPALPSKDEMVKQPSKEHYEQEMEGIEQSIKNQ